jgi:hypothetical protein
MGNLGERRVSGRASVVDAYANKYIDGVPHAVRLVDVSESGLRIRRLVSWQPETTRDAFPLELWLGGSTLWAWTRRVWRWGPWEALTIVSADALDHARFKRFLRGSLTG